jgi:hypothetical protein
MVERPILFSGEMVRAIIEGKKWQTRRPVKGVEVVTDGSENPIGDRLPGNVSVPRGAAFDLRKSALVRDYVIPECPFGKVGDRLWVKETHFINYFKHEWHLFSVDELREQTYYRADYPGNSLPDFEGEECNMTWRPSIHMPRWASRITLEITSVRVERVQKISANDALAEGCPGENCYRHPDFADLVTDDGKLPKEEYAELWDSIYGKTPFAWERNPFVWVVEFKVVERRGR